MTEKKKRKPYKRKSSAQRLKAILFERLAAGETLTKICADPDMRMSATTVLKYINPNDPLYDLEFAESYRQAREIQAELMLDSCIDIADDDSRDYKEVVETVNGVETKRWEYAPGRLYRAKARIDTRIRFLEKTQPRKYGTRVNTALSNADGSNLDLIKIIESSGTSRTQDIVKQRREEEDAASSDA